MESHLGCYWEALADAGFRCKMAAGGIGAESPGRHRKQNYQEKENKKKLRGFFFPVFLRFEDWYRLRKSEPP